MQGALESVEGVEKVSVSVKEKEATVIYNAEQTKVEKFSKIVSEKAGSQFKVTENTKPKNWIPSKKKSEKTKKQ